jgi:hypothetical protein
MLKIHYAAFRDTLPVLKTADFTRTNVKYTAGAPAPLGADYPDGQLGGHVVVHTGSYEVGVMTDPDEAPIGLFINDAAGSPFENTPAVGSGKSPFVSGSGSVCEVDIFETFDSAGDLLVYTAGNLLYGSANGLVTKELVGSGPSLGTCYRTPGVAGLLGVRIL